ncbi:transcriptional regulator [Streptomyces sp. WAC04189]|uniref:helix-turn-helix domain-containing protein n=1 Tax=Streptomyces sp. WAC04189 TaxID=2487411 RepID=UPI000FB58EC7|nr:helix-turn-helix domain-containing protein [Streptomyces sp. WAC04189]RSS06429.1 transcriptional regulator [Streptomyces sp. WAC04189]
MAGDDFAGLLGELKDRSGLSYGALGKRLHMSASTLHRYVSGEVVPVEFAPVERLARVCRATPEELLELHRRWIRADALRGVKKNEGASASAAAGEEGRPEGERERSQGPAEPTAPVAEPTAPVAEPTAPVPEPAPPVAEAGVPVAAGPASSEPASAEPEPASAEPASTEPASAEPASPVSGPAVSGPVAPVPKAPRRRVPRAALYAASGVVAVSIAVALVANLVSGTGEDGRRGPAADAGAVPPSLSASGSVTPSTTPSRSASASPSASPSPSGGTPSASASRRDTAVPPSRPAPASGPPFTVSTTPYYWDSPCDHAFLVDRSPKNVLKPPAQQDAVGWATAYGAVSANRQTVVLTVQGTGPETVVLKDLHVRVVSSEQPLDWDQYVMGNGCGGKVDVAAFDVALDLGDPLAMPIGGQRDFPYSVTESDLEVFHVNAHTSEHDVSWYLELEWSSGGREGTLRVDDHGRPFRTSASKDDSYYAYPLGSDHWELVEEG